MQLLEDDVHREATYKSVTDVRESKGKPQPIASDYYTMMAWLQNYMIVLENLFGKRCPLLKTHKRLRVTLINMKRMNGTYFSSNNITNLIWRLFVDSRTFFSTMTNERDLLDANLPVSNIDATTQLLSTFQPIRGDDLPLELRPSSNKRPRETVQNEPKSSKERKGLAPTKNSSEKEVVLRPDFCHPIISNAMKPVHDKIKYFNLSNFFTKAKVSYADITPKDKPVYPRMMVLGKCFVGCNGTHSKITDDHAKKVHDKIKSAIRATISGQIL